MTSRKWEEGVHDFVTLCLKASWASAGFLPWGGANCDGVFRWGDKIPKQVKNTPKALKSIGGKCHPLRTPKALVKQAILFDREGRKPPNFVSFSRLN